MVERLRRMQEVAGSNLTFFKNSFVLFVYLLFFFHIKLYVIKINLFVKFIKNVPQF